MDSKVLFDLKKTIILCKDENQLLDLEINLKHVVNIFNFKLEYKNDFSEEEIKDIKNSISLAVSYLNVISWKLQNITTQNTNKRVEELLHYKKEILEVFEISFERYLTNFSRTKILKEENSELKSQLNELKNRMNSINTKDKKNELKQIRVKIEKLNTELLSFLDKKIDKE